MVRLRVQHLRRLGRQPKLEHHSLPKFPDSFFPDMAHFIGTYINSLDLFGPIQSGSETSTFTTQLEHMR